MRLVIESDGTLNGTVAEFCIRADEIPRMIQNLSSKKKKLVPRRLRPEVTWVCAEVTEVPEPTPT